MEIELEKNAHNYNRQFESWVRIEVHNKGLSQILVHSTTAISSALFTHWFKLPPSACERVLSLRCNSGLIRTLNLPVKGFSGVLPPSVHQTR